MKNTNSNQNRNQGIGNVKDLLLYMGNRPWPSVIEQASIDDAVEALSKSPYSHIVYVTDEAQVLQGVVAEETLVKYLFIHYHDDMVDTRALISRALSEHASDLMRNERLKASPDDDLDYILEEMITCKVEEVPVMDEGGRMVGDITMKDIIRYHRHLERETPKE